MNLAALNQLRDRRRSNGLRHRVDAKDSVGAHRHVLRDVHRPQRLELHELAASRDREDNPWQPTRLGVHPECGCDARQRVAGEPDLFRLRARQTLRRGGARRDDPS